MDQSTVAEGDDAASSSPPVAAAATTLVPFLRVKPGNFSRLLYTNPVCLLTSSLPAAALAAAPPAVPAAVATLESDISSVTAAAAEPVAAAENSAGPSSAESASAPAAASSAATAVSASTPAPASSSGRTPAVVGPLPSRNVMTISWLTATSNHGEFVMSMHGGRCTARLVNKPGDRFVLNVPVKGMEDLVKRIGGCSGSDVQTDADADPDQPGPDKFERLRIATCRPGNKPLVDPSSASAAAPPSASDLKYKNKPRPAALLAEDAADLEDAEFRLTALPQCVAHLVCEVTSVLPASATPPMVQAHNVLFCRIARAYVKADYWVDGNNFIPAHAGLPPYLTFLGSGNFAYVTR